MLAYEDSQLLEALSKIEGLPDDVLNRHQGRVQAVLGRTKPSGPQIAQWIDGIEKKTKVLSAFFQKSVGEAVSSPVDWRKTDTRVVDVRLCAPKTPVEKFRKGLGERSLALQFHRWEIRHHGSSRLSELFHDLTVCDDVRESQMPAFIRATGLPNDKVVWNAI